MENPKSYSTWHHRKWVVAFGLCSLDAELGIISRRGGALALPLGRLQAPCARPAPGQDASCCCWAATAVPTARPRVAQGAGRGRPQLPRMELPSVPGQAHGPAAAGRAAVQRAQGGATACPQALRLPAPGPLVRRTAPVKVSTVPRVQIAQNFSNYSAWHYRTILLHQLHAAPPGPDPPDADATAAPARSQVEGEGAATAAAPGQPGATASLPGLALGSASQTRPIPVEVCGPPSRCCFACVRHTHTAWLRPRVLGTLWSVALPGAGRGVRYGSPGLCHRQQRPVALDVLPVCGLKGERDLRCVCRDVTDKVRNAGLWLGLCAPAAGGWWATAWRTWSTRDGRRRRRGATAGEGGRRGTRRRACGKPRRSSSR